MAIAISNISKGVDLRWLLWVCGWISIVTFALRVYVRVCIKKVFGWDDRILAVSVFLYAAFCLTCIISYDYWRGHQPPTFDVIQNGVNLTTATSEISLFSNIFLRISIALFFVRFVLGKWQRRFMFSLVGFNTVMQCVFGVLYLFQCGPPQDMLVTELADECGSSWAWYGPWCYISVALNASTDIILAMMPISNVATSKMRRSSRVIARCLIALGACGSIAEFVRLAYIDGLDQTSSLHPATQVVICSIVSTATAITAVSAAALRPLVEKLLRKGSQQSTAGSKVNPRSSGRNASLWPSTVDKHDTEKAITVVVVESDGLLVSPSDEQAEKRAGDGGL